MEKIDIAILVRELNAASKAYYNSDKPIMSDAEFDNKLEELRQLENKTGIVLSDSPTQNVGTVILDNIPKVTHKTPMLSLAKCHSVEEIKKFANGYDLISSVKLDGLSCRLVYENGDLIRAESRGNGLEGNLITEHVKQFRNVPLHINKKGTYIVDGEALIKLDDFAEINKNGEYKTARNLAAGTLASLDTSVVRSRRMRWYAWEVIEGSKYPKSFLSSLMEVEELGFETVPFGSIDLMELSYNEAIEYFLDIAKKEHLPQDGIVFKFENVVYGKSLGNTDHHFNNGIAWKAANDSVETELVNIEYTMGKTGILTPVAIFKPVEIDGTIVEKASLHNLSVMHEIMGRTWKGQKIGVYKANMIIPAIRWAEQFDPNKYDDIILDVSYINIPITCPICGHLTKIVKENHSEVLICNNHDCQGKLLGKLTHYCSKEAMNIDGLSEATLKFLIDKGWVKRYIDLYNLDPYYDIWIKCDGFGTKSVLKILDAIKKSTNTTLSRFINSLSIPLIGKTASKQIANACNNDIRTFMTVINQYGASYFSNIDGIGDTMIISFNNYWKNNGDRVYQLCTRLKFEKSTTDTKAEGCKDLSGLTFVITGSLNHFSNRDELKNKIESCGGKVSGTISVKTSYLINNDINSTSSKNQKAKSFNIPIISEDDFLQMIKS